MPGRRRAGRAALPDRRAKPCGIPLMSDATTAAPAAIASSNTTPNDSPSMAGKHDGGRPQPAPFSASEIGPAISTPETSWSSSCARWGPPPATQSTASRPDPQTPRAGPRAPCELETPDEEDGRFGRRPAGPEASAATSSRSAGSRNRPAERERDLPAGFVRHGGGSPRVVASSVGVRSGTSRTSRCGPLARSGTCPPPEWSSPSAPRDWRRGPVARAGGSTSGFERAQRLERAAATARPVRWRHRAVARDPSGGTGRW